MLSDSGRHRQLQYDGFVDRDRRHNLFERLVDRPLRHHDYVSHGNGDFDAEHQRGGNGERYRQSPCGGNVTPLTVDAGPTGLGYVSTNVAYVTVLVCVPNTTNCQTIDHVMVDTGSSGLRLLSSAAGGEFNLSQVPLPPENDPNNNNDPYGECLVFLDGFVWGTVNTADVVISGETAKAVPVQVILPSTSSPGVPTVVPTRIHPAERATRATV